MHVFSLVVGGQFYDIHINNKDNTNEADLSTDMYSQYVWQKDADAFIRAHRVNHPDSNFFLYNAMQTVHSPLEAPAGMTNHPACADIPNADRRTYCAMLVVTDSCVENLFEVLGDNGYKESTLFVFSADNGGANSQGGYNMPLRGRKATMFEGGVRAAAFIWGEMIPKPARGQAYTGLIHLTDWMPTFMSLAQGSPWTPSDARVLDGYDVYDEILAGRPSPRTEIIHNACDGIQTASAIRSENFKLITNEKDIGYFPVPDSAAASVERRMPNATALKMTQCENGLCSFLFDIEKDPTETTNLFAEQPEVVAKLQARLETFHAVAAPCQTCGSNDPRAIEEAEKTGYLNPWTGTPPGAPPRW